MTDHSISSSNSSTNALLDGLPEGLRTILLAEMEPISMPVGTVLYEAEVAPKHVHFMTSGMASIVASMEDGEAAEVGIVGREGCPEALHLLGPAVVSTRCFIQIEATALRMRFRDFERHFLADDTVRRQILRFVQYQSVMLGQLAACNRLHEVEQRLARWLLMVDDRLGGSEVHLTQEFLAMMLGARRTTVTVVAGALQRGGLIEYRRGRVRILDRENLIGAACECYGVTLRLFDQLCAPHLRTNGHVPGNELRDGQDHSEYVPPLPQ